MNQTNIRKRQSHAEPIFKNRFLEALTYTSFPLHVAWYSGTAIFSLTLGFYLTDISIGAGLLIFFASIFLWTLVEYTMHRYVFHFISDNQLVQRFHHVFHGIHHEYPREEKRTMMPPAGGLIFASVYFLVGYLFLGELSFFLTAGLTIGYLIYSGFHYSIHKFQAPKGLEFLWTHHLLHHYQEPEKAFGVSTRIWDRIFQTMPTKQKQ